LKPIVNVALRAVERSRETILLHAKKAPGCNAVQSRLDEFYRRVNSIATTIIKEQLLLGYPHHKVNTFEELKGSPTKDKVWGVDAICGEENFVRGINRFCTVVGFWNEGHLNHAVVVDHWADSPYYVSRGERSYHPFGTMRVSDSHNLKSVIVATRDVDIHYRSGLEQHCGQLREFGCLPLDLVALGCRQTDALCAGNVTALEADVADIFFRSFGAVSGDWSGGLQIKQRGELLASNSQIFKQLATKFQSKTPA